MLAHPFAGPLLLGRVEDQVNQVLAGLLVRDGEDVPRDLDQVTLQFALIPVGEDLVQLLVRQADGVLEDEIRLADELHVAVFDAVVHHLDVVPGPVLSHPVAAGDVILRTDLGGDRLQDVPDVRPGLLVAAGHDARSLERSFLAAGDAGADEEQPRVAQVLRPAVGVVEVGVAAVDEDVPRLQQRLELVDDGVDRFAGLDHDHRPPGALEAGDKFFERVVAFDPLRGTGVDLVGRFRLQAADELIGGTGGAVVDRHGEAVVGHVENEVLAHDGQADESDVVGGHGVVWCLVVW